MSMSPRFRPVRRTVLAGLLIVFALAAFGPAAAAAKITSPKEEFGFTIGDDYQLVNYKQLVAYWRKLDAESDRLKVVEIGKTAEGRTMVMAIITSPANQARLARYKDIATRLALAKGLTDASGAPPGRRGQGGRLDRRRAPRDGDPGLAAAHRARLADDERERRRDPAPPRRCHPPRRPGQPRRARARRRLVHARKGPGQEVDERRPGPLPEVHRSRQQPRFLHEHPAGDQGRQPAALHRMAPADPLQPPPDRAGRDRPVRAALPRSLQLRLRPAHPGRHRPRRGGHAQPLRHRGQARRDDAVGRRLLDLVERRPQEHRAISTTSSAS